MRSLHAHSHKKLKESYLNKIFEHILQIRVAVFRVLGYVNLGYGFIRWINALLSRDAKGIAKIRDRLDVEIGEPYYVDTTKAPEEIAEDMRKRVVELYDR